MSLYSAELIILDSNCRLRSSGNCIPRFALPYLVHQYFTLVVGETNGIEPSIKFLMEVQRCLPSMHTSVGSPVIGSSSTAKMREGTKKFYGISK